VRQLQSKSFISIIGNSNISFTKDAKEVIYKQPVPKMIKPHQLMERYKMKVRELQIALPLGTTLRGNKKSIEERKTLNNFKDGGVRIGERGKDLSSNKK
jgi:hypothetical protein